MTRIIAIGNRLMKDDAAGLLAAEQIKSSFAENGIDFINGETDAEFVIDQLKDDDFILILDAVMSGKEPGNVYVISLHEALSGYQPSAFQHDHSIFDLMILNKKSYSGYLIGIEAAEIDTGNGLSEILSSRFDEVCMNITQAISDILREEKRCMIPF